MLTVPQAARRVGKDPETVRRWIRSGRLRARKVGTQHVIDEAELERVRRVPRTLPLPKAWSRTWTGEPQVDWVEAIRSSRRGR